MEYFLLKQSHKVVNPIQLMGIDGRQYTTTMTHQEFRKLDSVYVAYISYVPECEFPDVLVTPTYMVSDMIHKVLKMYDENLSFKTIQVFPDVKDKVKEAARTYWICDCVMENCLHADAQILPNGEIKQVILDRKRMKGRDVFRVAGMIDNKLIVSLPVAESILRRCPYGVEFEKVIVR